jgi:hypothetical protein
MRIASGIRWTQRAYECYVEYWNGKVKEMEMEMEPRRRSGSVLYDRRDGNLRDTL